MHGRAGKVQPNNDPSGRAGETGKQDEQQKRTIGEFRKTELIV